MFLKPLRWSVNVVWRNCDQLSQRFVESIYFSIRLSSDFMHQFFSYKNKRNHPMPRN